ncbi:SDR family oxidoreductase [Stakelama sp. CBK3Z-3]|uniref:SDR family oxidoreductase n=1 Tax=Stakelama flava TaxID=2860338 RepID=A0ABS6XQ59_9SPHN|nr:SDR family oxidoreductase [Stakelama flava]MBW4332354.1 SDR family oxidoreductase [Stakelama flava]
MYAITGATGQLGRLVVEKLLETVPADQIVAAVRDPAKARDLSERGIVVREADYDRPETLEQAFAGVEKVLLISSSEVTGRFPQHKAVIEAAKKAGVRSIAYTSMLRADETNTKLGVEHAQTEQAIKDSGLEWTMLRNGWYTENHLLSLQPALEQGAFIGAAGEGRFSSAARADYAAAAAAVLTGDDHAQKVYELAADASFTLAELASEVSRQSGSEVAYNNLSETQYAEILAQFGLPPLMAEYLADADARASEGALHHDGNDLSRLIGRPTTPLADVVGTALAN